LDIGTTNNKEWGSIKQVVDYVITSAFARRRWYETVVIRIAPGVALNSQKLEAINKRELINAYNATREHVEATAVSSKV